MRPTSRRPLAAALALAAATMLHACSASSDPTTSPPGGQPPGPGGGGSSNATLQFCAADAPVWFAYKNDNASWTPLAEGPNHSYAFTPTSSVALAFVLETRAFGTTWHDLAVVYTTAAELKSLYGFVCSHGNGSNQLNGSVANLGNDGGVRVTMGSSFALAPVAGPFTLDDVASGPQDLVAVSYQRSGENAVPSKMIIRRGINVPNGSTIPVLDFASSDAFPPAEAALRLNNVGGDDEMSMVNFVTGGGTLAMLDSRFGSGNIGHIETFYGVPANRLAAGDLHYVTGYASPAENGDGRGGVRYVRNLTDVTLDLRSMLNQPEVTLDATAPYAQPRVKLASQADYPSGVLVLLEDLSERGNAAFILVTAGYLGGTPTTWDVRLPDLSAVAGFDAAWGPGPEGPIDWTVEALAGTLGGPNGLQPAADGQTIYFGARTGTLGGGAPVFSRRTAPRTSRLLSRNVLTLATFSKRISSVD